MRPSGAPSSASVVVTAATTGSVHSLAPLMRSGASTVSVQSLSTTAIFYSTSTTFMRFPITVPLVAPVQPPANQLPPISKFIGEDSDQEGGNFEEWIEQSCC